MFEVIYNPLLNVLLCIGVALIVGINIFRLVKPSYRSGTGYFIFWLFVTIFSMYYCPEYGDSFNGAQDLVDYIKSGSKGHYEDIYYLPLLVLPPNYYLWRFCVWGLATWFVVLGFRHLNCPSQYATSIFFAFTLIPCFYYMRNSLGFASFYLALILIFQKQPKSAKPKYWLIFLLLVLSSFAHNSMPVYYCLALLAILLPINTPTIIISLLIFPIIQPSITDFASYFLSQDFIPDSTSNLGMNYLSAENSYKLNRNGFILLILRYCPFFVVFAHAISHLKKDEEHYNICRLFFMLSYLLLYLAFCFYGTASNHLFLRFSNTSTFPMAIAMTIYLSRITTVTISKYFVGLLLLYYIVYFSYLMM